MASEIIKMVARREHMNPDQAEFLERVILEVRKGFDCPGWDGAESAITKVLDGMTADKRG